MNAVRVGLDLKLEIGGPKIFHQNVSVIPIRRVPFEFDDHGMIESLVDLRLALHLRFVLFKFRNIGLQQFHC